MRVLVVEDEVPLARHIASALTEAGHDSVVIHDGEAALHEAAEASFDLIVLDVGLPRIDGFDVLRSLRARHITSRVLMLTARGRVNDRVTGLQLGADDYLVKPFAMQELVARVRALGRRYAEDEDPLRRQEALQAHRHRQGEGSPLLHEPHPREEVAEAQAAPRQGFRPVAP